VRQGKERVYRNKKSLHTSLHLILSRGEKRNPMEHHKRIDVTSKGLCRLSLLRNAENGKKVTKKALPRISCGAGRGRLGGTRRDGKQSKPHAKKPESQENVGYTKKICSVVFNQDKRRGNKEKKWDRHHVTQEETGVHWRQKASSTKEFVLVKSLCTHQTLKKMRREEDMREDIRGAHMGIPSSIEHSGRRHWKIPRGAMPFQKKKEGSRKDKEG